MVSTGAQAHRSRHSCSHGQRRGGSILEAIQVACECVWRNSTAYIQLHIGKDCLLSPTSGEEVVLGVAPVLGLALWSSEIRPAIRRNTSPGRRGDCKGEARQVSSMKQQMQQIKRLHGGFGYLRRTILGGVRTEVTAVVPWTWSTRNSSDTRYAAPFPRKAALCRQMFPFVTNRSPRVWACVYQGKRPGTIFWSFRATYMNDAGYHRT